MCPGGAVPWREAPALCNVHDHREHTLVRNTVTAYTQIQVHVHAGMGARHGQADARSRRGIESLHPPGSGFSYMSLGRPATNHIHAHTQAQRTLGRRGRDFFHWTDA